MEATSRAATSRNGRRKSPGMIEFCRGPPPLRI